MATHKRGIQIMRINKIRSISLPDLMRASSFAIRGYIKTNMSNEHFSYLTYITYFNTAYMVSNITRKISSWCLWNWNHRLISSAFFFIIFYIFELHLFRLSYLQDLGVIEILFWASGMKRVNPKYHGLILWISQSKLLSYICIYKYTL